MPNEDMSVQLYRKLQTALVKAGELGESHYVDTLSDLMVTMWDEYGPFEGFSEPVSTSPVETEE